MMWQCSKWVKIAQIITDQRTCCSALKEILEHLMYIVICNILKDRNIIYSHKSEPETSLLGSPVVQKEQIFHANCCSQG